MGNFQPFYTLRIIEEGNDFACQVTFDIYHPVLQGHFPGNPVVPGAWLIQILKEAMEKIKGRSLQISSASQVKFLQPVIPSAGMVLLIKGEILEEGELFKVNATYSNENTINAKLKVSFTVQ